ncbi:hypothetical protein OCL06_16025 [Alteromonas sp. ASW11-19]|uniref:Transcriptional regulator n=1 Tax=Alteromonas salexigens TaxID=2982530 RepID=A0ABT2VS01_9ALTE|nr:hypothetical protein [Alteromonas salexigens]MCU7556100.1 hypothetical protein [Alteromonas salexigens]
MDAKKRNFELYCQARKKAGATQTQWATLFSLGGRPVQQAVSDKERQIKGVNNAEALACSLLNHLIDQGFDVSRIEFDAAGNVVSLPKQHS